MEKKAGRHGPAGGACSCGWSGAQQCEAPGWHRSGLPRAPGQALQPDCGQAAAGCLVRAWQRCARCPRPDCALECALGPWQGRPAWAVATKGARWVAAQVGARAPGKERGARLADGGHGRLREATAAGCRAAERRSAGKALRGLWLLQAGRRRLRRRRRRALRRRARQTRMRFWVCGRVGSPGAAPSLRRWAGRMRCVVLCGGAAGRGAASLSSRPPSRPRRPSTPCTSLRCAPACSSAWYVSSAWRDTAVHRRSSTGVLSCLLCR